MNYVQNVFDGFHYYLFDLNAATLSGAIDVVAIPQPGGELRCTPFHVRFGKIQLLRSTEKVVSIFVNDIETPILMKLGRQGEAYFVEEVEGPPSAGEYLASPINSPPSSPRRERPSGGEREELSSSGLPVGEGRVAPASASPSPSLKPPAAAGSSGGKASDAKMEKTFVSAAQPAAAAKGSRWRNWLSWRKANPQAAANAGVGAIGTNMISLSQSAPALPDVDLSMRMTRIPSVKSIRKLSAQGDEEEDDDVDEGEFFDVSDEQEGALGITGAADSGVASGNGAAGNIIGHSLSLIEDEFPYGNSQHEDGPAEAPAEESALFALDLEGAPIHRMTPRRARSTSALVRSVSRSTSSLPLGPYKEMPAAALDAPKQSKEEPVVVVETTPIISPSVSQVPVVTFSELPLRSNTPSVSSVSSSAIAPPSSPSVSSSTNSTCATPSSPAPAASSASGSGSSSNISATSISHSLPIAPFSPPLVASASSPPSVPVSAFADSLDVDEENLNEVAGSLLPLEHCRFGRPLEPDAVRDLEARESAKYKQMPQEQQQKSGWRWWWRKSASAKQPPQPSISDAQKAKSAPGSPVPPRAAALSTGPSVLSSSLAGASVASGVASSGVASAPVPPTNTPPVAHLPSSAASGSASVLGAVAAATVASAPGTSDLVPATASARALAAGEGARNLEEIILAGQASAKPSESEVKRADGKTTHLRKSVRPSAKMLALMNLKLGANPVRFAVKTELRGKQEVRATIFYWEADTKLVISDIDGTITKSDVMGQLMPMLGRDWTHMGVNQLYCNIARNGYRFVYLTSRAIGQAGVTKAYIRGLQLPEGPVIMSPDRLLVSFNREVIQRRPEEFKIAALKDVKSIFPDTGKTFYAGFGNRQTDVISYRAVGVPQGRIFTINPAGEIINVNSTYKKTYSKLNDMVQEMFPPMYSARPHDDEEYNDFNYWKVPLPPVESDAKK